MAGNKVARAAIGSGAALVGAARNVLPHRKVMGKHASSTSLRFADVGCSRESCLCMGCTSACSAALHRIALAAQPAEQMFHGWCAGLCGTAQPVE